MVRCPILSFFPIFSSPEFILLSFKTHLHLTQINLKGVPLTIVQFALYSMHSSNSHPCYFHFFPAFTTTMIILPFPFFYFSFHSLTHLTGRKFLSQKGINSRRVRTTHTTVYKSISFPGAFTMLKSRIVEITALFTHNKGKCRKE